MGKNQNKKNCFMWYITLNYKKKYEINYGYIFTFKSINSQIYIFVCDLLLIFTVFFFSKSKSQMSIIFKWNLLHNLYG